MLGPRVNIHAGLSTFSLKEDARLTYDPFLSVCITPLDIVLFSSVISIWESVDNSHLTLVRTFPYFLPPAPQQHWHNEQLRRLQWAQRRTSRR